MPPSSAAAVMQPGGPAAVAGREQLGAVDGEGGVRDRRRATPARNVAHPHRRAADGVGRRRRRPSPPAARWRSRSLRPRTSATRPPMISPMPAGVAVTSVKIEIIVAENPRTSFEVAVLEQAGRGDEEVGEQGDAGRARRSGGGRSAGRRRGGARSGGSRAAAGRCRRPRPATPGRRRRRGATSRPRCRRAAGRSRPRRRRARWPSPAR